MSYRHTLGAALESLREIEDLVRGFPDQEDIPAVEIDLTLQKLRNLYELMLMMRKEKDVPATTVSATDKKVTVNTPSPAPAAAPAAAPSHVQTLSDQFKGGTTLHESLHPAFAKEGETLAYARPVNNLLTAIGINDRFTFIRELFKNDAAAFENTIGILNNATSFNDAYNYMIQHFNWDMDSEAVQQLLDVIRRKFIKGRHE